MDKLEYLNLENYKRIVIKVGSAIITNGQSIDLGKIEEISQDIAVLHNKGKEVVLVSSGAVVSGMVIMGFKKKPEIMSVKQALASIGQPHLMSVYKKAFKRYNTKISQVLISYDDILSRKRYINAKNTFEALFGLKVVPIVNENDTVATKELMFGDNDKLSLHILNLLGGDLLIILTDVDGVYNKDPKLNKNSKLFDIITPTDTWVKSLAGKSKTGEGGISSKIETALLASNSGKRAIIINGKRSHPIRSLFTNMNFPKTVFEPKEYVKSVINWINNCKSLGRIYIDNGAYENIKTRKGLLPKGIKAVEGVFPKETVIDIILNDKAVGKGIVNYDSTDIEKIKGLHSSQIKEILGYKTKNDVISTNNLILQES